MIHQDEARGVLLPMKRMEARSLAPASALVALAMLVSGLGCGMKKVNECNALVGVINANVKVLEKAGKPEGDGNGSADLKNLADAMDKVAGDTGKVALTIPELKKIATDYQAMATGVAKAARDMAQAADAHDTAKITSAQQAMEKAVKAEEPLVEGLNKFCGTP